MLSASFPAEFNGLVADRRGDLLLLTGKTAEARAEFTKAYSQELGSHRGRPLTVQAATI